MTSPHTYVGCVAVVPHPDNDKHPGSDQNRYLLVRETKAIARGRMALPGGSLEADESLEQGAIREVVEETGLVVESLGLVGIFHCERTSENSYGVNFVFGTRVVSGELTPSPEHPELDWFTLAEIEAMQERGELRGAHAVEAVHRTEAGTYLPPSLVTTVPANL